MCSRYIWGYLTVIGAALIHFSFGYNYSIGNMNPYIIAYMGISKSQSIWIKAVILAGQSLSMPIGGLISKKIGFIPVTILGTILTSGGILLSRVTIDHSFGAFLATYSVMFGLGMGIPYSVLFSVASEWFPKHRGLVVGIIAAGLGLGSLVFSPIQTALINPHNIQNLVDPRVKDNLPRAFSVLGGIMLALQVVGLCLCRKRKEDMENEKSTISTMTDAMTKRSDSNRMVCTPDLDKSRDEDEHTEEMFNSTITQALRSFGFYIIFSIIFLDVIAVTIQSATFKVFGKDCHLDDWFLTTIATLSSAFNCIGRITWGFIIDKFSFKVPLNWMLVQWALLMATFPIISEASYIKVLYAIWVFGLFFTMAGHFVLMPAACTSCFGPKNMATIYGLLYLATAPSSLLLSAIISQFNIEGEWDTVYWSCAAVLSLGFILSLFLKDQMGGCKPCFDTCVLCCPSSNREYSEIQIIDQDENDKI